MRTSRFVLWVFGAFGTLALSHSTLAALIYTGSQEIEGTFKLDLDTGYYPPTGDILNTSADIWWEIFNSTSRALQADNGAAIINLGVVDFAAITETDLQGYAYGLTQIDGGNTVNLLVPGDVFAVRTNAGNYAKVIVSGEFNSSNNNGLPLRWETYAIPAPTTLVPIALASAVAGIRRRRAN